MGQVIYIDVLIAINLFVNYFILIAVSKFLYIKMSKIKIILGSSLGSIYSLYILFPRCNVILSLFIKLFMAATIVLVAFGCSSVKTYIKLMLCFYSMSFIFSGVMFALWCGLEPMGMVVNNGVVYFNISPIVLLVSTVISYGIIQTISKVVGRQRDDKTFCNMEIKISDKIVKVRAKIDTGHNIKEPFSGLPVVVVCEESLKDVVSKEIFEFTNIHDEKIDAGSIKYGIENKVRLIPFSTVLGKGILPAIKVDYLTFEGKDGKIRKDAYVAICQNEIVEEGFEALVGPELVG